MKKQFSFEYLRSMISYNVMIGIITILVLIGASGLLYWGYRSYANYQERMAQKVFFQVIEAYNAARKSSKEQELNSVLALLQDGYEQYKQTAVAPYFLSYKVQILLQQGKAEEALSVLNQMLERLPKDSMTSHLFGVTHALMLLDTKDEKIKEQGIEELKNLAADKHNELRDMAQYYLGDYYLSHNDLDQARAIWQELLDSQWQEPQAVSPWSHLAQETLRQIS